MDTQNIDSIISTIEHLLEMMREIRVDMVFESGR